MLLYSAVCAYFYVVLFCHVLLRCILCNDICIAECCVVLCIHQITMNNLVVVSQVRKLRNELMHSTNMKVTGDLMRHIQTLVDLLEDPPQLLRDPAARQAVVDIKKVIHY